MGAGHRAVGLILEIAQGGLSQPHSSSTAGSFPGRGWPEWGWGDGGVGGVREAGKNGRTGEGKCPAEASGQGMARKGSYRVGLNLRGGVVQIKPLPSGELKLEKKNPAGGKEFKL